jgi:hypothetical protein
VNAQNDTVILTARYWRTLALSAFGQDAEITAFGRWACAITGPKGNVLAYLFYDEEKARSVALGWSNCRVVDLRPKFVPTIRDDWEDRARERREEKQSKA